MIATLQSQFAETSTSWSIGAFGAIAEFHHVDGLKSDVVGATAISPLGAIRLAVAPAARLIAYEMLSAYPERWLHGVALCLPENVARMSRRNTITELGPDVDALRPRDRGAHLFDLGLERDNSDFCVRTEDAALVALLRAAAGTPLIQDDHALIDALIEASPHRVVLSKLGRIEVYQPIPHRNQTLPPGPHTHLLPALLRTRRSHSANVLIPSGYLPCVSFYPSNPVQDEEGQAKPFDAADYAAFQHLLAEGGEPVFVAAKQAVIDAVGRGASPDSLAFKSRIERTACRIALRQLRAAKGDSPTLSIWRNCWDAVGPRRLSHTGGTH